MSTDESPESLLQLVLEACSDEYEKILAKWTAAESKAQGTGTIAGVFIGGFLVYLREPNSIHGTLDKILLLAAISLLMASIFCALISLLTRSIPPPPKGADLYSIVNDLLRLEKDKRRDRLQDLFRERIKYLGKITAGIKAKLDNKVWWLRGSQVFLLGGVLCSACDLMYRLVTQ